MPISLFIPLLFCLLLPLPTLAAEPSLELVISTLETPFTAEAETTDSSRIQDVRAEFYQESQIASIDRVQRGRGRVSFRFQQPDVDQAPLTMFRWEYQEPEVQEIVSDGHTLWVYIPENRQVIESDISQLKQSQGDNPITFLNGLGNLSRDFFINWAEPRIDPIGNYILELRPRQNSQAIRKLFITVSKAAVNQAQEHQPGLLFPVLMTLIEDPNGNRTRIEFVNSQVNQGITADDFAFNPPAGIEVVKPGQMQLGL